MNSSAPRLSLRHPAVEWDEHVAAPGQLHAVMARSLELPLQLERRGEGHMLLIRTGITDRPRVFAAMTWIEHHQPARLFDLALGHDNLFGGDHYKVSAQFTVVNLANEYALYNFLSTFSGTHYVTPRTYTGQIGFHF